MGSEDVRTEGPNYLRPTRNFRSETRQHGQGNRSSHHAETKYSSAAAAAPGSSSLNNSSSSRPLHRDSLRDQHHDQQLGRQQQQQQQNHYSRGIGVRRSPTRRSPTKPSFEKRCDPSVTGSSTHAETKKPTNVTSTASVSARRPMHLDLQKSSQADVVHTLDHHCVSRQHPPSKKININTSVITKNASTSVVRASHRNIHNLHIDNHRSSNTHHNLPSSPGKRRRLQSHPFIPSLASVASPQDDEDDIPRKKKIDPNPHNPEKSSSCNISSNNNNNNNSNSRNNNNSKNNNNNNNILQTAKTTALQCIDHATRRQSAAQAALTCTSKICSSLKELWQDSQHTLSLARKSRLEAQQAEERAEGAAVKVKESCDLAVRDRERSMLELEEANAQAEEAWEFLRRVKGGHGESGDGGGGMMRKDGDWEVVERHRCHHQHQHHPKEFHTDHEHPDRRQNTEKRQSENKVGEMGIRVGTILEIPTIPEMSSEPSGGSEPSMDTSQSEKSETIHIDLKRKELDSSRHISGASGNGSGGRGSGGRFHRLWDEASTDLNTKQKVQTSSSPPSNNNNNNSKGGAFEPIQVYTGHSAPVTQILVVDQNRFLSSSWDKTVRLWDVPSGECLRVFRGHGDWVHSLCLSSNSGHFLSGSDDRTIKMWNFNSDDCVRTFRGHTSFVKTLALWKENHFLSGSRDKTIKLWMVGQDDCITTFRGHADIVSAIVPLGRDRFVSGSHDKTIKVWEVDSAECVRTIYGHTGSVKSLTVVGDSEKLVISGSDDRTIRLWDTSTGECLREFGSRAALVFSVTFICEGFFISCGGGKIQLWHIPSGSCVKSYDTPRIALAVACLDDERFVTGSDHMLQMWKF